MKFDPSAVYLSLSREPTPEEEEIGNLGLLYVRLRGIGSTGLYVRKVQSGIKIFTRYQTVVSDDTQVKHQFFRFVPSSILEAFLADTYRKLRVEGNPADRSYMNIWSMNEEEYGVPGTIFNEKLGIDKITFTPRKDILHSIIGYVTVNSIYGDIFNVRVGLNTNQKGDGSFFLYDPSFYDPDKKINFSRFRLEPEIKNFILRTIQYYYDKGIISFRDDELLDAPLKFLEVLEAFSSDTPLV